MKIRQRKLGNCWKAAFIYLAATDLSCCMWDLVLSPGIEPRPPALGVWSLSHWIIRQVPRLEGFEQRKDMGTHTVADTHTQTLGCTRR